MKFFLIFVAIVAGISFLKFIWDSYLTDKTEIKWTQYKQKFPAEAERTERNSFKKVDKKLTGKQGNLTNRLQNLMTFYNKLPPELNAQIVTNTANCFEFKMPVTLFEKVVGYNHVGVAERHPKFEMYIYSVSASGKKISINPVSFKDDLKIKGYDKALNDLINKMLQRPDYQKLASGEDFDLINEAKIKQMKESSLRAWDEEDYETAKSILHELIIYKPNLHKAYLFLIDIYLNEKDLYEANNLIRILNMKEMQGLSKLSDDDASLFQSLKLKKFELQEKRNS